MSNSPRFPVKQLKIISIKNNLNERFFQGGVYMLCSYNPEGVVIEVERENEESILSDDKEAFVELKLLVTKQTVLKKKEDMHVILSDDELVFLKLETPEHDKQFDEILKKVHGNKSVFVERTEDTSATQYFEYYGLLSQQHYMLQDSIRTSTYRNAIIGNSSDFKDKIVLDVGAGSGILSFFAAQAGAKRVYAVEASNVAEHAQNLAKSNNLSNQITVIAGKIEEIELPEKVDVIISEPMGFMLYNERMLETYLHAKKWLKPDGKMFPSRGELHIAPFTDEALYMEQYNKASFWSQTRFYNIDLSALYEESMKEYFRQPILDTFDINICQAKSVTHVLDFLETDEKDLQRIDIPLEYQILSTGTCHGLAFWFDVEFNGSNSRIWLSTSPTQPLTHWYQVRCLLQNPLFVKEGQMLTGRVIMVANKKQSYDITIKLTVEGTNISSFCTMDWTNPNMRYLGAPTLPPPSSTEQSPTESYWNHYHNHRHHDDNLHNNVNVSDATPDCQPKIKQICQ